MFEAFKEAWLDPEARAQATMAALDVCRDGVRALRAQGIDTAQFEGTIQVLAGQKTAIENLDMRAGAKCRDLEAITDQANALLRTVRDQARRAGECQIRKSVIESGIAGAESGIEGIAEPFVHKVLDAQLAAAKLERDQVFALGDLDQLETDLTALETTVQTLADNVAEAPNSLREIQKIREVFDTYDAVIGSEISGISYDRPKYVLNAAFQRFSSSVIALYDAPNLDAFRADARTLRASARDLYDAAVDIAANCHAIDRQLAVVEACIEKWKTEPAFDPIIDPYAETIANLEALLTGSDVGDTQSKAQAVLRDIEACARDAEFFTIIRESASWTTAIDAALDEIEAIIGRVSAASGAPPELTDLMEDLATLKDGRDDLDTTGGNEFARRVKALYDAAHELLKAAAKLQFEAMLEEPGGKAALDALVAGMSGRTGRRKDEMICQAAIEARFNVTLTVGDGIRTEKLPRMYDLLLKVPEADTVTNSKLEAIEWDTEHESSGNYHRASRIVFNDLPEDEHTRSYVPDFGDPLETIYYDATTLHEVGHAVDDNEGFMATHGGSPGYGQWMAETLDSVIEAHGSPTGGNFFRHSGTGRTPTIDDLRLYLRMLLTGRNPVKPSDSAAPLSSLTDDWDAVAADPTAARCRDSLCSEKPWNGGKAMAEQLAIGGRVYQESYPGKWTSYALEERASSGVSTYQWRAPGEWFAEIYALYYLGKLKSSHPMKNWLDRHSGTIATGP
ncbi:hypothetical protein [Arenibaculum pallidiluteum]|uniref:hypothetical protein n=1 Tax=Arenibaculum pallidiluteum TaxID=2812559 RepID=UPI001A96061E|nr:hypothetical protein [Arenibaculum pallidiluteum]